MYGEQTWASRQREAKRAERKEIIGSIIFIGIIAVGFYISLFA